MSRIRVLIVDDSAFARKVLREILAGDPRLEVVGYARDGLDALERIAELRPDVITLDLIMPELDGLGVLRALPAEFAPRVVIVSVSGSETELAIEALQAGAVELVTKPTALATDRLYELSQELREKVVSAAGARRREAAPLPARAPAPYVPVAAGERAIKLIVVGTSTGGPQALTQLFRALPAGLPPIAVALHIPEGYTAALAERIRRESAVKLEEARHGQELLPGHALLAPGGRHLAIRRDGERLFADVTREPLDSIYHPSVDLLFTSAAAAVGAGALGLVMTGMGNDGLEGSRKIVEAGGLVLAESAASCVVYGMPRCVIEAGLAKSEACLEGLPELLVRELSGP